MLPVILKHKKERTKYQDVQKGLKTHHNLLQTHGPRFLISHD